MTYLRPIAGLNGKYVTLSGLGTLRPMRIVVAPDKYAGTLSAVEAARAIADGWRRQAPGDELILCPMADGGPGFLDVLHEALGGEVIAATVRGPP